MVDAKVSIIDSDHFHLTTIGILFTLLFETFIFFERVSIVEF